ncbi:MAG: type II toxin-antitoxin system HicA family toxin [Acidobacteria bacterium]|nr:type II toxin-antitoxin system HicA family toxin [Acidobacteriota bacterium]
MKLKDLIKYLEASHCLFVREGGSHTIYKHSLSGKMTSVPRHREIKKNLAKKICDDLGIERPKNLE